MTTSATLPSTTGPVHAGGFSTISEDAAVSEAAFETPRPIKRCLIVPLTDSCKKRRKQATPVRISAADSELVVPSEGKPSVASPEPDLWCPLCQLAFNNADRLQNHIASEHANIQCKKEPEDAPAASTFERSETPIEMSAASRSDLPWMNDLQNKEWVNPNLHGLPFSPATSLFMTLPPFTPTDNIPTRQPVRIFNPDAYCDLCNKEFCNKYFLKTHKANKHGIYTDPPTSEPLGTSVNIPSYATSMKIPTTPTSTNIEIVTTKIESKPQTNPTNQFGEIFSNNPTFFANKMFSKISKPNMQGVFDSDTSDAAQSHDFNSPSDVCNGQTDRNVISDDTIREETLSPKAISHDPMLFKNEFGFEEGTYFTPGSKMSPGQQSREFDLNRLRRIGVMNPKAFCEICCKEYCNKYFLRTHKMKRHGIFIPDESKDGSKDGKIESSWSHNMQTSPLNLIMAEQNSLERKVGSPTDISCEICGIKFQNASLAQLHNVSVHSRMPQVRQDINELCTDEAQQQSNTPDLQVIGERNLNSSDAISEDLQKLQTMILQLNDLDANRAANTCNICNKECENRYYLHAHMMTEHGLMVEDGGDIEKNGDGETPTNNNSVCDLCNKEVQSVDDMKKHLLESHPNHHHINDSKDDVYPSPDKGVIRGTPSVGQFTDRRSSMNLTPSSSYCEICNKELCNKYFMKTHMQRMHGIEIENGAQIGGVICDICNKELCSKYFLRVHKHNTHGIVEYGSSLLQPRKPDAEQSTSILPVESDSALKPGDLADLSHRYFTHFTEVCTICNRRFRSTKWLKAHLLSDHGQIGAEKWTELEQQLQQSMSQNSKANIVKTPQSERVSPTLKIPNGNHDNTPKVGIQNVLSTIFGTDETTPKSYHCTYCSFSTPVLPFLFVHERSHSMPPTESESNSLKCPVCSQCFSQTELLQHHLFTQHPFFPLSQFFNGNSEAHSEIPTPANTTTTAVITNTQTPKESNDVIEDESKVEDAALSPTDSLKQQHQQQTIKQKKVKRRLSRLELSPEVGQSLNDLVKRKQIPAAYALPRDREDQAIMPGYVMQPFLLDEPAVERRFIPSVVFLPVLQKQSAPITVTFTLTPA